MKTAGLKTKIQDIHTDAESRGTAAATDTKYTCPDAHLPSCFTPKTLQLWQHLLACRFPRRKSKADIKRGGDWERRKELRRQSCLFWVNTTLRFKSHKQSPEVHYQKCWSRQTTLTPDDRAISGALSRAYLYYNHLLSIIYTVHSSLSSRNLLRCKFLLR